MPKPPLHPSPGLQAARRTRALALACCGALIALCVLWEAVLAPVQAGASWWLAAKALPLLVALPGLARMRMYTYRWLSLLVWLYFTEGVVRAVDAPPARYLALAEVALAMGLFAACVAHVRLRQKWAKADADVDADADANRSHAKARLDASPESSPAAPGARPSADAGAGAGANTGADAGANTQPS
jgi:uncharacterized membrane protein